MHGMEHIMFMFIPPYMLVILLNELSEWKVFVKKITRTKFKTTYVVIRSYRKYKKNNESEFVMAVKRYLKA
jgi:hypothetical protein